MCRVPFGADTLAVSRSSSAQNPPQVVEQCFQAQRDRGVRFELTFGGQAPLDQLDDAVNRLDLRVAQPLDEEARLRDLAGRAAGTAGDRQQSPPVKLDAEADDPPGVLALRRFLGTGRFQRFDHPLGGLHAAKRVCREQLVQFVAQRAQPGIEKLPGRVETSLAEPGDLGCLAFVAGDPLLNEQLLDVGRRKRLKRHHLTARANRGQQAIGAGRDQDQNPAVAALQSLNIPFGRGVPHDYRGALSPRIGISYSPGSAGSTVVRAGFGLYYNDLAQNGWAEAFQAVNAPFMSPLAAGEQGFVIDPDYHTPYALQASFALEQRMGREWRFTAQYQHHQGVHQYRRYEYVSGITLPASAPSVSLFRSDNRSQYDGLSFLAEHHGGRYNLTAHYTLAKATTYGAVVGELFDYVNGVSDVRNPFGPGDHGPSGEDIRHRFVVSGTLELPYHFQLATLAQFESARPFTLTTPEDLNGDGVDSNDRAVVNGAQTSLDQFRGVPFSQIDLRVSREFRLGERFSVRPFAEFFNLLNRSNPGNNFVTDIAALPTRVNNLNNATAFCLDATCTSTRPIRGIEELRVPGGALGDFFGLGTTVGNAFAAQLGIRVSF